MTNKKDKYYMSFTAAFPLDMARKLYEKKWNTVPAETFVEGGLLKLGPEPERRPLVFSMNVKRI